MFHKPFGLQFPISFGLALALAHIASADEPTAQQAAESLVKAFISTCVQDGVPDPNRVEATAKLFGWKEIAGLEGTLLAPANPNAKGKSWLVQGFAQVPFMLGVSKSEENNDIMTTCTVVNPYAPVALVLPPLEKYLQLGKPDASNTDAGQRYTYWNVTSPQVDVVYLIDSSPTDEPGINLTSGRKQNIR